MRVRGAIAKQPTLQNEVDVHVERRGRLVYEIVAHKSERSVVWKERVLERCAIDPQHVSRKTRGRAVVSL